MGLLTGKTAIVTGAARGIGKAIALKFAAEGANVAFTDLVIDENGLNTEKEIAAFGVKAKGYASNAASFEDTANVVAQIKEEFGSVDILVNNALRFFEIYPGQNARWMMFPQKKYWTFLANIAYAIFILFCVISIYNQINEAIISTNGEAAIVGVEPLAFGFLYMAVDMFFISCKNMLVSIVKDAMDQNKK